MYIFHLCSSHTQKAKFANLFFKDLLSNYNYFQSLVCPITDLYRKQGRRPQLLLPDQFSHSLTYASANGAEEQK